MDEKSGEDVDLQVAQVVLYTNPSCGWVLAPFLKDFGSGRFHAPSLYALEQPYSQVKPKTSKEASTSQKTISDFEVVEDMDFPKEAFEALVTGSGLFPMHNQAVDSNSRDASTGLSWTEYGSMLGLSAFTIDHGSENGDYPRNINGTLCLY